MVGDLSSDATSKVGVTRPKGLLASFLPDEYKYFSV